MGDGMTDGKRTNSWNKLGYELSKSAVDGLDTTQVEAIKSKLNRKDILHTEFRVLDFNTGRLDLFSPKDQLKSQYYREKSYLFDLASILQSGTEVEAVIFGIPVKISPISKEEG